MDKNGEPDAFCEHYYKNYSKSKLYCTQSREEDFDYIEI